MTYIGDKTQVNLQFTKVSASYSFDSSQREIIINDIDYKTPILVINLTRNETVYNPNIGVGGTVLDRELIVDFDTTSHADTDRLLIVYEYEKFDRNDFLLSQIIEKLDLQNQLLMAILS